MPLAAHELPPAPEGHRASIAHAARCKHPQCKARWSAYEASRRAETKLRISALSQEMRAVRTTSRRLRRSVDAMPPGAPRAACDHLLREIEQVLAA